MYRDQIKSTLAKIDNCNEIVGFTARSDIKYDDEFMSVLDIELKKRSFRRVGNTFEYVRKGKGFFRTLLGI